MADYISNSIGLMLGVMASVQIALGVAMGIVAITLPGDTAFVPASYGAILEMLALLILVLPARASSTLTSCL